ncbi:MAG: SDR family oxidoreductase [Planctomycetes bacterium]|nr:SDR family oxidoreductase [Planctomycetota bacterium]
MTLRGKGAVVTGASRGIGAAAARALAAEGARLLLVARTQGPLEELARALMEAGTEAHALACDVTEASSVRTLADKARAALGGADILVNNAGGSSSDPFSRVTLEEWNRMFAWNATSAFLCTQALLPGMLERGWGRVVNIASVAGLHGAPYIAPYAAAKHALVGLTRSLAAEVAGKGVTVNAVCPGYVDTDMTGRNIARVAERTARPEAEIRAAFERLGPQGRFLRPEEVAGVVAFLCTGAAGAIHGQAVALDGGRGN